MNKEQVEEIVYTKLGFCGCGNPDKALLQVVNGLKAIGAEYADYKDKEKAYEDVFGEKAYWLCLYILNHAGLTEHGTAVSSGWLSPTGKEFLEFWQDKEITTDVFRD